MHSPSRNYHTVAIPSNKLLVYVFVASVFVCIKNMCVLVCIYVHIYICVKTKCKQSILVISAFQHSVEAVSTRGFAHARLHVCVCSILCFDDDVASDEVIRDRVCVIWLEPFDGAECGCESYRRCYPRASAWATVICFFRTVPYSTDRRCSSSQCFPCTTLKTQRSITLVGASWQI